MSCKLTEYSKSFLGNIGERLIATGKPKHTGDIFLGKGFVMQDFQKTRLIDISYEKQNRRGHLFGFGSTRVGKTRCLENKTEQDILAGHNVVIIDPKVDNELLSKVYQTALKAGRKKDFAILSAVLPQYSIRINPLANYYLQEEIIGHVLAAVPVDDEFFYNVAFEITTAIVTGSLLVKKYKSDPTPLTYRNIAEYVSYKGIESLKGELEQLDKKTTETKDVILLVEQILQSPIDYFAKVTSTLRTTLTQMIMGNMGKIIGNVQSNKIIDRLERDDGVILYVQTGAMLVKKSSDILAKTVLSMLQSLVGRRYISNMPFKQPLCIDIDEASNALYWGVENLFNKAGGSNTMISAWTQSTADIVAALGEERSRMILDNTNSKIFMRVNDIDTAKTMIEYGGKIKKFTNIVNSGNIMGREAEDYVLKPEHLLRLKPREFYYFGFEGQFFGKTKPVEQSEIIIVPPKIFGEKD